MIIFISLFTDFFFNSNQIFIIMKRFTLLLLFVFAVLWGKTQTVIFEEDFETPPFDVTATGAPLWSLNTTLSNSGTQSYHNEVSTGDTSYLTTSTFSTSGNTFVVLEFAHICKIGVFDGGIIEVSVDNGTTWTQLTGNEYLGTGQFGTMGNRFVAASYPTLWQASDNLAIPDNTWWRQESFDLSAIAGNQADVQIRFVLYDGMNPPGSGGNYGWLLDDIKVTVMTYLHDLSVDSIISPEGSFCYDGNEAVSIEIGNYGLDTIFGGYTAAYSIDGGTPVVENPTQTIAPGESITYTFATPINFTLPGIDSTFILKTYVSAPNDPFMHNDTLDSEVTFLYIPPAPTAIHDTVDYGDPATVAVISPHHINWYATPSLSDDNVLDTGTTFTTPPLYGSTAYYASASSGKGGFIITEICHFFTTGTGSPSGGWPSWMPSVDYIEITGAPGADLDGYTLEQWNPTAITSTFTFGPGTVLSPDGTAVIRIGTGTATNDPANFYYNGAISGSFSSGTAGGKILKDPSGDIIDAVGYPGGSSYTFPSAAGVDPSQFALTWSPGSATSTAGTRLIGPYTGDDSNWVVSSATHPQDPNEVNPNVEPPVAGCEGPRTQVWAIVENNPPIDAGVVAIDEPVSPTNLQPQDLVVSLQNFGTDPLTSVDIHWTHNGAPQTSFSWTGHLLVNETDSVVIGTLTPSMGNNHIVAWSSNPNGVADPMPANDTASRIIEAFEPLCGTYTLGGPGSNFSSFADAQFAMEYSGVTCPVVIQVEAGVYNERLVLDGSSITGLSATNTVTFRGESGATLFYDSPSSQDRAVITLNGASHFRFDSLNIQIGPSADWGWGVYIGNNTENIEITNSYIDVTSTGSSGIGTGTEFCGIVASGNPTSPTSTSIGINDILIENNTIVGGYYGVILYGASSDYIKDVRLNNNELTNTNFYAVRFAYVEEPEVLHNTINLDPAGSANSSAVYFWNVRGPFNLSYNTITNPALYGIYLSSSSATPGSPSLISNNAIGGGFSNSSIDASGIYITGTSDIDIFYNSINCDAPSGRTFYALSSTGGLRAKNNSFVYNSTGNGYAMYVASTSSMTEIDHNNYYSNGSNFVYYGANRTSLTALQSVNVPSGNDQNSVTGDPIYMDTYYLYPLGPILNEAGTPIPGITDDIIGTPRDAATPDIGAFEFTPATADIGLIEAVLKRGICLTTSDTVALTVRNIIGDTIDFSVEPLTAKWEVTGPVNSSGTIIVNSGIVPPSEDFEFFDNVVDLSTPGIYTLSAYIEPNAVNYLAINDTLWNAFVIDVPPYIFDVYPDSALVTTSFQTVDLEVQTNLFPGILPSDSIPGFTWSLDGIVTSYLNPDTTVGTYTSNGLYQYIATYDCPCGIFVDTANIYVNIPPYDLFIEEIVNPEVDLCYYGSEYVTVSVGNLGSDTIFGGFTASYVINGGTPVSEVMTHTIAPGSLVPVTFATPIDFILSGTDTTFYLNTYVSATGDNNPYNDTLGASITFNYVPPAPIGINDTILYGNTATLEAISTYDISWYASPSLSDVNVLDTGAVFTTAPLYGNTPFYASASGATTGFIITEICHFKTATGSPTGGWPSYLLADDYIEITGPPGGNLSNYTLEMWSTTTLNNSQTLDPGTVLSPNGTAVIATGELGSSVPSPTDYYYHSGYTGTMGSATPQGYILKNSYGVIVDAVGYPGSSSYTFPSAAGVDPTVFALTWAPGSGSSTSGTRLVGPYTGDDSNWVVSSSANPQDPNQVNPSVESPAAGCESLRTEVWVIVTGNPPVDAGVVSIDDPQSPASIQPHDVYVTIQNFGTDPLTSVDIGWSHNGAAQTTHNWTGNLNLSETETVNIGSFTPTLGNNYIVAWTSSPNGVTDPMPLNDTSYAVIEAFDALCGTYDIGGPMAHFSDFSSVSHVLSQYGVTCPVVFNVNAGTYYENIELGVIPGASSTNTISFIGQPGNVLAFNPTGSSSNAAISLMDVSHLRFDNLNIQVDPNATSGWGVYLGDNTSDIEITNCNISVDASGTSTNFNGIVASGSPTSPTTSVSGVSDIFIENNTISGGYYGIVFYGGSSSPIENTHVIGNEIIDSYYYGIRYYYANQPVATNNYIDLRKPGIINSRGIDITSSAGPFNFSSNIIKNPGQYGIYITSTDAPQSLPSLISNNSIGGGFTNTGTLANGIYITTSDYIDIVFNSINADGNTGRAINILSSASGLRLLNNSFVFSGSGNGYAAYIASSASIVELDHNNYYSGSSIRFVYYNANRANLSQLQSVNIPAGNDQNSVSGDPVYYGTTNLFPASSILNDVGTPFANITTDITGASRDAATPDIGAYEYTPSPIDAALLSIENIDPISNGGSQVNLQVVIANWGTNPLTMIPIKYSVNGGTPITETWIGTLQPYATDVFNFATPITIPNGNFTVCAYTDVPGDGNHSNDTVCADGFGIPFLNISYSDDFEGPVDMFYTVGLNNQWERGVPTANVINSANSPVNAWATNLSGNHAATANYNLMTPRFNFQNVANVELSFWYWIDTELDTDGGRLQFSQDGGQQWQTLGTVGDPNATNWYNSPNINGSPAFSGHSGGWVNATYDLTQFNNFPMPIQFRFNFFASGSGQHNGFAIDDFELTVASIPQDAGVVEIVNPDLQSVIGTVEDVEIVIENFGTDTLYIIPVRFRIGTGVPVQETWTGVLPPGQTTNYTFTATISEQTSYNLCAYTRVTGDSYFFNDTTCKQVTIVAAPYDAGATDIIQPGLQTPHNNPVDVSVRIRNFGTEPITELDIAYDINAGSQTVETWTGVLGAGNEMVYNFNATYISMLGNYIFCVETQLSNDMNPANDRICKTVGGVGMDENQENIFTLEQNTPNPAQNTTVIGFNIPKDGQIVFKLTNALGQKVYEETDTKTAGRHIIQLDTRNLATGVYYYSVEYDEQRLVRQMVVQ